MSNNYQTLGRYKSIFEDLRLIVTANTESVEPNHSFSSQSGVPEVFFRSHSICIIDMIDVVVIAAFTGQFGAYFLKLLIAQFLITFYLEPN